MAYSTVKEVRALAGIPLTFEVKQAVKMYPYSGADGSNKVFYVPFNYIGDYDDDGTVDGDDVVVYDDGTAVTVSSITIGTGAVTLSAAPAASSLMTCKYAHSPIMDSEISTIIDRMDDQIEKRTRSAASSTSYTQTWNGDGETTIFYFKYRFVTAITSITVDDSTTYTEGTDYWLQPKNTEAQWIEFNSPPSKDKQNISITYSYGATNTIINQLSKYMAAREVVLSYMAGGSVPSPGYSGTDNEMVFGTEARRVGVIRRFDEEIKRLWDLLGGTVMARCI